MLLRDEVCRGLGNFNGFRDIRLLGDYSKYFLNRVRVIEF